VVHRGCPQSTELAGPPQQAYDVRHMPLCRVPYALSVCTLLPVAALAGCGAARSGEGAAAVPSVASIPVAPLRTAAPWQAATPVETADPVPPVRASAKAAQAAETGPDPTQAALRVVLADEGPFRWPRTKARGGLGAHGGSRKHPGTRLQARRPAHPAPGIVIDVSEAEGGPSALELQRTARAAGYWPIRECYEEGLRRDRSLGGKVSLDVSIGAGRIERAAVVAATLKDESVALCVGRETSHLPLSSGSTPALARIEITLSAGDDPVSTPRPAPHAEQVRQALRASWPAVEQCYASELARHPDIGGRIELRFRARSTGEIVAVTEDDETRFADVDVTRCILGVYRSIRLPVMRARSVETKFTYAMHLEAAQGASPAATLAASAQQRKPIW